MDDQCGQLHNDILGVDDNAKHLTMLEISKDAKQGGRKDASKLPNKTAKPRCHKLKPGFSPLKKIVGQTSNMIFGLGFLLGAT